ncbi:actin cytoskeleton and mitosis protein [Tieghemiomyces parasiticus]|uniref:Actin cytoskeleton and mitosis protein n=1 Tax=Tieghemiomyces parasiticus TaxID=78921 RepID=A0A9W8AGC8_9FUNG|nr:actin cytoskeleton and mitosis protein [Tieghemiomyces parasiticus]
MADSREQRFNAQLDHNRYLELKPARARERERCVALGLIPDPNVPRSLDDAITLIGTCQDMCPLFEREEREYQNNVERFEYTPGTRRIDPVRAVKSFHRSAAGNDQPLPSDVRPPDVLLRTLDYLMTHIVTSDEALRDSHGFVRDRTRSIRTDFTLQNSRGPEAVEAHEQIARYHLICCHLMADVEGFSIQQEKEQLGKATRKLPGPSNLLYCYADLNPMSLYLPFFVTFHPVLQSLQEFYSDLRADGVVCPNEAEFRAYHICLNLSDNDMIYFAQNLDPAIYADPAVQLALAFHAYAQYGRNPTHSRRFASSRESSPFLFNRFFRLLASPGTPYLLACVLELHFDLVRRNGLHALNSAIQYVPDSEYPLARLAERLGLDGPAQAAALCRAYKIGTTDDTVQLGRKGPHNRRIFEDPERPPHLGASQRLVAQKRTGEVLADIVKGRLSRFTYPPHRAPLLPTAAPVTKGIESQCTVLAADIIDNWLTEMTATTVEEVSRDTVREAWANEQRTRRRLAQAQWCEQRAQTFLDNEVTVSVYLLCQHELAHARASHLQRRWAFRTWHSRYAARKQAQIDRQRQQQHIADSLRAVQAGSFASRPPSAPSTNSLLTVAGPVRNPHLDLARAEGVDHGVLLTNAFQRSAWQSRGQRELWRPGRLATRLCETLRQGQAARADQATGPRPPPSAQLWVLPATPNGLSDRWLLTQFRQPATSDSDGGQTVEPPRAVLGALWRNCPALPDSARILFEQSLVSRSRVSPRPTLGVATTDPTSLEGTGRIDNVDVLAGLIFHVAPPPCRSSDAGLYWEQQRCRLVRALECFTQRSRIPVIVVYLPPDNDASTVTLGRELAAQLCLSDLQSRRLLYEYTVAVMGNPAAEKSSLAGESPQIVPVCDFVAPLTHALSTLVTQWLTISDHFSPYITFDVFAGTLRNHLLDAIDRWERQIACDLNRVVSADSTIRPDTARTVVESYLATLETRIATSWQTFANLTNELLATVARSAAFFNSEGSPADPPALAAWPALEERAIPSSMTHPTTSAATVTLASALEIVRDFQVDMDKYLAAQFPNFPNTPQVRAEVGKALERYQVRLVRLNQTIHAATDDSVESTRTLSLDLSDLPFPLPHILYRTVQLAIDPYLRHLTPECPVPALRWQTCDLTTTFTRHLRARTADLEATLAAQWAPATALAAPSPPLSEPGEFIISPCPLISAATTHFTTPKRQLSTRQVLAATHKRARRSSDHPLPTTATSFPWRIAPTTRTASFSSVRPLPATSEPSPPARPTPVAVAQVAPRDVSPTPHLEAAATRPAPYSRLASLISSVRASLPKP